MRAPALEKRWPDWQLCPGCQGFSVGWHKYMKKLKKMLAKEKLFY
jgi:hypothetical protein